MILVLGGTTEGRIAVNTLEEAGQPFYYSTKGNEQEVSLHNGIRLQGAMGVNEIEIFCAQNNIKLIIDAAHPFAELLHQTLDQVNQETGIPIIRFERIFPQRENDILWCRDYNDAIKAIKANEILSLLALTGVQSIGKLKPLWQDTHCYFRILDRESSRKLAFQEGFPQNRLFYYQREEDESALMQQLRPEAILIKESGISGGFCEKVEAARALGIEIFAIGRPQTPPNFFCVNGKYGLRRMVERLLPEFFPLHSGLTTGTCATAAAVAATWDIFNISHQERPELFPVILPGGETIQVSVEPQANLPHSDVLDNGNGMFEANATVIKVSGDDPDVTNGMKITANVAVPFRFDDPSPQESEVEDYNVIICGGEGVGIVTLPGLGLEVGESAINPTPRKMIEENVKFLLRNLGIPRQPNPIVVTISVCGGEEIAKRTFNPRLGIEGGISIIGTSGIVKPFSSEAFINSIRKSMEVALATRSPRVVINSGAKSEKHIKAYYPDLPTQAFVHYGNFIGETLKMAAELNVLHVTLGLMMGKAVKLAEGYLNTHSKEVVMNKAFIGDIAFKAGCKEETLTAISEMNLARELWEIIPVSQLKSFCSLLIQDCRLHCVPLLPNGELTILLINENGEVYI